MRSTWTKLNVLEIQARAAQWSTNFLNTRLGHRPQALGLSKAKKRRYKISEVRGRYSVSPSIRRSTYTRMVWRCWRPCGWPSAGHFVYWTICPKYVLADLKLVPWPWNSRSVDTITLLSRISSTAPFVDREETVVLADKTRHNVVAVKSITLAACPRTASMEADICLNSFYIKPKTLSASSASLKVAYVITKNAPGQSFYVEPENLPDSRN